eukprot:s73_g23.t1
MMLQRDHQGLVAALREEAQRLPADGDEGGRQGQLMKDLKFHIQVLEDELDIVNQLVVEDEEQSCLLAALNVRDIQEAENEQFEPPAEPKILQTHTVPLSDVMSNLPEWVETVKAEYISLTETTGAIRPIHKDSLRNRTDIEYAPGKLVAVVKPGNKKKARLVGRKTYDTYAGGVDGVCVRAVLRKAGERPWSCAAIDVRTAFLLAPRRGQGVLVVKPPKVLVACGLIAPTEVWEVKQALYGLQSSPKDWSAFRDADMRSWSWEDNGRTFALRSTKEPNLWRIVELYGDAGDGQNRKPQTVGHIVVYVDDILVTGSIEVVATTLKKVQDRWKCSEPQWMAEEGQKPMTFCGFEVKKGPKGEVVVTQKSYAEGLTRRHEIKRSRPILQCRALW